MAFEDPLLAPDIDLAKIHQARPGLYSRALVASYAIRFGFDQNTTALMAELRQVREDINAGTVQKKEKPKPNTVRARIWKHAPAPLVDTKPVYVPKFQLSEHDRAQLHQAFSRNPSAYPKYSVVVSFKDPKAKALEVRKDGRMVWKPVPGRGWQQF